MRRIVAVLVMVFCAFFILPAVQAGASAARDGDDYYTLAQQEEQESFYKKASRDYKHAASLYLEEGKEAEAVNAKNSRFRMESTLLDYRLTESNLKRQIKRVYPWATNGQIQNWTQTMGLLSMDLDNGKTYYYYDEPNNLRFRNPEVMAGYIEDKNNPMKSFMEGFLRDYVDADYSQFHPPYDRPLDILIDFQLSIEKSKLPKTGTVRVWWPFPIKTDSQSEVQIISLEPSDYVVQSPDVNADIGVAYFEIPVDTLKKDLTVRSQVRYLHYQQRFSVDPANVGQYDKDSPLYKEYTRSHGNTLITPEIEAKAKEIVGSEKNPYLSAKLIYDYIVNHIDYSFTPHESLQALGQAESVFVHTHGFGDCGAQSIYFSAMCRSLGIPSRTCGGYQMLGGYPGTHFWAEFYLPNYGWVPVDVTAAEFAYEVTGFPDADLRDFKNYFFAQQDPLRMIIQQDVDLSLTPLPAEETYFKLAFQNPVFMFYGTDQQMAEIPSAKFYSYSEQNFNFPNAYRLIGGSSFEINAADFGLVAFPDDTEVILKDRVLDKTLLFKAKSIEFLDASTRIRCVLPDGLNPIAYSLYANSKSIGEKKCSRPLIVQSPIKAVESNLIPQVVKSGSEPAGMALLDRMQHFLVPGAGIAVINEGRIEWAKGYGVTEAGGSHPVTADTVFQACSMSKPVSVTGIMLLAQSGVLDITRNVNDYLRSWQVPDNQFTTTEKVTIERLMSHTGGTNVDGFGGYGPDKPLPTLVEILNGLPPANNDPVRVVYRPGSEKRYSGGGMEILHLMAEDLTGMPFGSFMKDNLFRRLGMNSSDFVQPMNGPLSEKAAKGHDADGTVVPGGWNTYPELIAAGLWTTPSDLARLILEVQNAATKNRGTMLSKKTADHILEKQPNSDFGLGFELMDGSGGLIFNHSGANLGYKGFLGGYKDRGQGVVVMTNGDNGIALSMEIIRSVAKVYGWPDYKPEEANLIDVALPTLQSYVGSYKQTDGVMTFQVYLSGADLMMRFQLADVSERLDMYATASDTFLLRSQIQGTLTFSKDTSANVTGFTITGPTGNYAARKM